MADDHEHKQCPNPTPRPRIVQEIDSFDEHKSCKIIKPTTMSSSPKKRVQESDDHLQEVSLSFAGASTDQKKRKTTGIGSSECVPVHRNPRILRLFGVNLTISCDSRISDEIDDRDVLQETSPRFSSDLCQNNSRIIRLFGVNLFICRDSTSTRIDDDGDPEKRKREKAKGKEKIVETGVQESEDDHDHNGNSQTKFLMPSASHAKGFIINETKTTTTKKKKEKTESSSYKRKSKKNPNVGEEEQPTAPVVPPLFHPRVLEEIQQHERPVFLFEKKLNASDIARGLNRLFITRSQKLVGFLTAEEMRKVEDAEDKLVVITKDAQGNEFTMHLTKWHALDMIVLKHEWLKLVTANRLQNGDSVQGWGYRRGDEFRLAIDVIRKEQ